MKAFGITQRGMMMWWLYDQVISCTKILTPLFIASTAIKALVAQRYLKLGPTAGADALAIGDISIAESTRSIVEVLSFHDSL
jgi:hypothetical protein